MYHILLIFISIFVYLKKKSGMDNLQILNLNVNRLCDERGWTHKKLAKEMGIMEAALSRALAGNPQLKTIEKIAKALDVSIKSLFDDPDDIEGFILLHGKPYHFNSNAELLSIQKQTKKGSLVNSTLPLG